MKKFNRILVCLLTVALILGLAGAVMTPSAAHAAPAAVNLGTASPFAILAGTPGITDAANASQVTGNVGLSPATGAGIGLLCSQVTGTIYSVDAAGPLPCRVTDGPLLVTAKNDLTAAFIDLQGRAVTQTVATELGGQTLTPEVYGSNSTTFQITAGAGPLVLDGLNDPSSVFIFEMNFDGTGLTVGPASVVSLVNGASACNVFWRVNTASIDTTAVFKGNILALTSITVNNGASIEGRLLARNGTVTLINDTITVGPCATSPSTSPSTSALPTTGTPSEKNTPWNIIILSGIGIFAVLILFYFTRRKQTN